MRWFFVRDTDRRSWWWLGYTVFAGIVALTVVAAWAPWHAARADAQDESAVTTAGWLEPLVERVDGDRPVRQALAPAHDVDVLLERARAAEGALHQVEGVYDDRVAPIARVIQRYRDDPELARRVAVSLVREARRAGLEPRVLLAVLLMENPWIDPKARSPVGAVGLMQIMPLHRGHWSACPVDLEQVESNICYGAQIFAHYLRRSSGDVERALLRYNGCVNGTNTPDCHRYPYHVYARAGRASMLAWLTDEVPGSGGGAAAP